MQLERVYFRAISGVIVGCYLFAAAQFWLTRPEMEAPAKWTQQFYILLGLSCALSFLAFVYRKTEIAGKSYLIAKFIIFLLIGYAGGKYVGVEFTLLTVTIVEISAYFQLIPGLMVTLGAICITLVNQHAVEAWDVSLSAVSAHDILSLAGYACIIAAFSNIVHLLVSKVDEFTLEIRRLDHAVSRVMTANVGFQEYAVSASTQSVAHERKRISRDIHDTAVHTFITVIMLAETAIDAARAKNGKVSGILQQLISLAKEGVKDTRQALRELRAIEEPLPMGLKAIYHLAKVFEEVSGVSVTVDFGNLPWTFHKELDQALYRMIQEGLTNAFRHGKATEISIRFWIFESELSVRIFDNGEGSTVIKKGIGLQGMEERLQKFGGLVEAKNLGGGFELIARIPIDTEKIHGENSSGPGRRPAAIRRKPENRDRNANRGN